jgi:hypothetical protein
MQPDIANYTYEDIRALILSIPSGMMVFCKDLKGASFGAGPLRFKVNFSIYMTMRFKILKSGRHPEREILGEYDDAQASLHEDPVKKKRLDFLYHVPLIDVPLYINGSPLDDLVQWRLKIAR